MLAVEPADHADALVLGDFADSSRPQGQHTIRAGREPVPLCLAELSSMPLPASERDECGAQDHAQQREFPGRRKEAATDGNTNGHASRRQPISWAPRTCKT